MHYIIFNRDVFHVSNSQEVCFRFRCTFKMCQLRLVNNDNGMELPCYLSSSPACTVEPNKVHVQPSIY